MSTWEERGRASSSPRRISVSVELIPVDGREPLMSVDGHRDVLKSIARENTCAHFGYCSREHIGRRTRSCSGGCSCWRVRNSQSRRIAVKQNPSSRAVLTKSANNGVAESRRRGGLAGGQQLRGVPFVEQLRLAFRLRQGRKLPAEAYGGSPTGAAQSAYEVPVDALSGP